MPRLMPFIAAAFFLAPMLAYAETRLVMAERTGCYWCEKWHAELGDIYPKTSQGEAAPLQRYWMHDGPPDGLDLAGKVAFSPTFILVQDGREVGRIEGYPGQDFFWGLLDTLFQRANIETEETG